MAEHAVIIGSGAGASVAGFTLAQAGWEVTFLEKGRNYYRDLDDPSGLGRPTFGNDEIRNGRGYPGTDTLAEPRTGRTQEEARQGIAHSYVGALNNLPQTVGGGTTHWDAKVPRFWKIDFAMLSEFGPIAGADVADWPFGYDDLAPYYDRTETVLGVNASLAETPGFVLEQAPRGEYPMPPGPQMYGASLFSNAARHLGYEPHPFPMAANTVPYDNREICVNCGFCSGYGCPNNSRAGAGNTWLRRALLAGASLIPRAMVTGIRTDPATGRAVGVEYLSGGGREPATIDCDLLVLAASCIESTRLALLSHLADRSGLLGRNLCFHADTFALGTMPFRTHPNRGRSGSDCMLEPAIPDTKIGHLFGLPVVRGGVVEIGGAPLPIEEAHIYDILPTNRGVPHKNLMRSSPARDRAVACQMIGEDLAQLANTVDLDPTVKDIYGLPVARITYSTHLYERLASWYWGPRLAEIIQSAGGEQVYFLPSDLNALAGGNPIAADTRHISGTMRMGTDAATSVVDEFGRMWDHDNIVVCDGSVFPSSGAVNPTNTLMSVALRSATAAAYGEDQARLGPVVDPG